MTGAAGLIGGEVCSRLAKAGHAVTALTHNSPDVLGNDGLPVVLAACLKGDVTRVGLGIVEDFAAPDVMIHCAASLKFDAPYEQLETINVGGTRNVVAFAKAHGAKFLHVSTAYVCGTRDGPIVEGPVAPDTQFANGYEASKAAAEAVVHASAVPHCIVRPAIVLGDSDTGQIRRFDAIYQAFAMIARGLVRQMPVRPGASLDFVAMDNVASGIAALAERMEAADGAICHLTSGAPIPVEAFAAAIGAYPQFHAPELVDADSFDPASLTPSQRRIHRAVAGAYASYFQRNPYFDDAVFHSLTGMAHPPAGAEWLTRLIDYAIAKGLLPAAAPSAHQDNAAPAAPSRPVPTASRL